VAEVIDQDHEDSDAGEEDCEDLTGRSRRRHHRRIPRGHWRDGICDCFAHGVCHPMLWLACCCRPLALGQILTRSNLSAMGNPVRPGAPPARASAFQVVTCAFVVYYAVTYALALLSQPPFVVPPPDATDDDRSPPPGPTPDDDDLVVPAWAVLANALQTAASVVFGAYLLALLIRARAHVRHRYDIPEHCCVGCEDCCCAVWLPCCATLQIARHTADYRRPHSAACCTDTGLPPPPPRRTRNGSRHRRHFEHDEPDRDEAPYVV
jgi:Cys-rich protein (TIGR01571 family)